MADEVWVNYEQLHDANDHLKSIVEELNDADDRTDAVLEAIGKPFGLSKLHDRVSDFEGRWDDKRTQLAEELDGVQKHVQGVIDGIGEWDRETAAGMEVDATGQNTTPKAV